MNRFDRRGGRTSGSEEYFIEQQLRKIPSPQPPADLLPQLLADVAQRKVECPVDAPARRSPARLLFAVAALAATIMLAVNLLRPEADLHVETTRQPEARRGSEPAAETLTSVFLDETNPCDILPPLPDWE